MPRIFRTVVVACCVAISGLACDSGSSGVSVVQSSSDSTAEDALVLGRNYVIASARDPNRCLSATNDAISNGSKLTLVDCGDTAAQTWLRTTTNSSFALLATKCLDVTDGNTANGTLLQMWDCVEGNTNQRWTYKDRQLKWIGQNKCMDLKDGITGSEATVQLWDCDVNNLNQQWKLSAVPGAATGTAPDAVSPPAGSPTDLTRVTAGFVAQNQYISNKYGVQTCVDVHDLQGKPFVQTYACNKTISQKFSLMTNGQVQFPSEAITYGSTTYPKGMYCLGVGDPNGTGKPIATLVACNANDPNQMWGQLGNQLVLVNLGLCLDVNASAVEASSVPLSPCTAAATQSWYLGDPKAAWADYTAGLANVSVANHCPNVVSIVDQSGNSAGAQKLFALYGGQAGLQAAVLKFLQDDCAIMYDKASDMPFRLSVTMIIDSNYNGQATTAAGTNSRIYINPAWFETFWPTDAPLKFKTDALLHHELAHVLQHDRAGFASGMAEGYANWVTYRAGLIAESEKTKGGTWADGYSTTAFFLLYLDATYPPTAAHQGYTWRLNLAVRDLEDSGGTWTPQYFVDTTGKSIDVLWADYQKSF